MTTKAKKAKVQGSMKKPFNRAQVRIGYNSVHGTYADVRVKNIDGYWVSAEVTRDEAVELMLKLARFVNEWDKEMFPG